MDMDVEGDSHWNYFEKKDGTRIKLTPEQIANHKLIKEPGDFIQLVSMSPIGFDPKRVFPIKIGNKTYQPPQGKSWKTDSEGAERLKKLDRLVPYEDGSTLRYVLKLSDYPVSPLTALWGDTSAPTDMKYVVQTNRKVVQRCILMSTQPGDLVLDPTCGSGTTAIVCEQWGRRWITTDTSRIAVNVAKTLLATASFPYYQLEDEKEKRVGMGFKYVKVPHVDLETLANEEPWKEETLFDRALIDKRKVRVAGPFTVETLQSYDPIPPEDLEQRGEFDSNFEKRIFDMLTTTGIRNGARNEQAVFGRIERLPGTNIHAVGWYKRKDKGKEREAKAYFHIGQKFSSVSKRAVSEAAKETRTLGDADWLVILGFAFDSDLDTLIDKSMGTYEISKVRMNDDLLQEGLLKKDKKAAAFVTIGEPDIDLKRLKGGQVAVEIKGLDIYDPIKDIIKPRDLHDIAYWMVDDDYDGSNFIVRQVFFCGGDKDEFDKWRKGLESIAVQKAKKNLQDTLKIEIDDEAFERLYGFVSHPITVSKKDQKIAVRVVSQFGEESTKLLSLEASNGAGRKGSKQSKDS